MRIGPIYFRWLDDGDSIITIKASYGSWMATTPSGQREFNCSDGLNIHEETEELPLERRDGRNSEKETVTVNFRVIEPGKKVEITMTTRTGTETKILTRK